MIIDIVTGERYSKTEFYRKINKSCGYCLFDRKINHYKARYILEENWEKLVVVLLDENNSEFNCIVPSSLEHYIGPLTSQERNSLGKVICGDVSSTRIKEVDYFRKNKISNVRFNARPNKRDRVKLKCAECDKEIEKYPSEIKKRKNNFCNGRCAAFHRNRNRVSTKIKVSCCQCNKELKRTPSDLIYKNTFCNKTCAAHFRNANKTHGYRRSKLEIWLEEKLKVLYPNLDFKFNSKEEIKSELDIYIPSLKLAFELNGIFHYEPIYGDKTLNQVQNNDKRKFAACCEHGISLCSIDISHQKYFKESTSEEFLSIVTNIINENLLRYRSDSN